MSIGGSVFASERRKVAVALIADQDVHALLLETPAFGVDVDTVEAHARAEILLPHLQRAALRDAEFEHHRRAPAERREVAVVDLEVVHPLVQAPAGVATKEGFEVVHAPAIPGRPGTARIGIETGRASTAGPPSSARASASTRCGDIVSRQSLRLATCPSQPMPLHGTHDGSPCSSVIGAGDAGRGGTVRARLLAHGPLDIRLHRRMTLRPGPEEPRIDRTVEREQRRLAGRREMRDRGVGADVERRAAQQARHLLQVERAGEVEQAIIGAGAADALHHFGRARPVGRRGPAAQDHLETVGDQPFGQHDAVGDRPLLVAHQRRHLDHDVAGCRRRATSVGNAWPGGGCTRTASGGSAQGAIRRSFSSTAWVGSTSTGTA